MLSIAADTNYSIHVNKPEVLYAIRYLLHQAVKANEAANRAGVPVIFRCAFVPALKPSQRTSIQVVGGPKNERRKIWMRSVGLACIEIVDDGQGLFPWVL